MILKVNLVYFYCPILQPLPFSWDYFQNKNYSDGLWINFLSGKVANFKLAIKTYMLPYTAVMISHEVHQDLEATFLVISWRHLRICFSRCPRWWIYSSIRCIATSRIIGPWPGSATKLLTIVTRRATRDSRETSIR